jgi:hypothetical protein
VSLTFSLWICFYMWNTGRHLNMRSMPFFVTWTLSWLKPGENAKVVLVFEALTMNLVNASIFAAIFGCCPRHFLRFFSVSKSRCAECKSGL